jgi:hydroxymethylbilane synthase
VKLRLGTRGSLLATTQSGIVADDLRRRTGAEIELVIVKTRGDQVQDRPLAQVGGKGLFTKELEDALLAGEIDFAVHSMKDMPTESPAGLVIASVPEREDPRDALVGARLADLPPGAVVGTGSVRRALQLRAARPDLEVRGIRGNVDTRIEKQRRGEYTAIVLALAGLSRLGRAADATAILSVDEMVPAVGQGALAVQARKDDDRVLQVLEAVHHADTGICVAAERAFLHAISGGCSAPAACHARIVDGAVVVEGVWAASDAAPLRRASLRGDRLHVHAMGTELARRLKAMG